jgi:hypothetical protein
MNLSGKIKFVPIGKSTDFTGGLIGDSINMAKAHRATFLITFGTITGNGGILYVYSGATDAAQTSALTFKYALGSAVLGSASADVLGTETTSAALTLTAATYSNKLLVVEVDTADMDTANGEEWLTLVIGAGATNGIAHIVAAVEPRYSDMATILA